jgi:hypothetical protein
MLNSLYYVCSIVAVLLIIRWFTKNDGRSRTTGLFAMKGEPAPGADGASQSFETRHGPALKEPERTHVRG